jgi:hypothetical protein
VLAVQKNVKLPKHHILNLPNLEVVMAMLSLKSRGFVREVFNWQVSALRNLKSARAAVSARAPVTAAGMGGHWTLLDHFVRARALVAHPGALFLLQWHYFFLTDTGIEYLRGYLHLPAEIVPATLKKAPAKAAGGREEAGAGARRPGGFGERREGGGGFGGERREGGGGFGGERREGGYRREGGAPREGGFGARREGGQ